MEIHEAASLNCMMDELCCLSNPRVFFFLDANLDIHIVL